MYSRNERAVRFAGQEDGESCREEVDGGVEEDRDQEDTGGVVVVGVNSIERPTTHSTEGTKARKDWAVSVMKSRGRYQRPQEHEEEQGRRVTECCWWPQGPGEAEREHEERYSLGLSRSEQ